MMRFLPILALLLLSCGTEQPTAVPTATPAKPLLITLSDGAGGSNIVQCDADGSNRTIVAAGLLVAPPHAGTMLYLANDALHAASLDGSNDRILVADGEWDSLSFGEISPDGKSFIIVESHTGIDPAVREYRLAIRNIDGTQRGEIAGDLFPGTGAAFSPDGERIAFIASDRRLYAIGKDGSGRTALTAPSDNTQRSLAGAIPDWSPDGLLIICDGLHQPVNITVVHTDGRDNAQTGFPRLSGRHPAWSPDGKTIALGDFQKIVEGSPAAGAIRWVDDPTRSTPMSLRWSVDGVRILFVTPGKNGRLLNLMIGNLFRGSVTKIDTAAFNGYWVEE